MKDFFSHILQISVQGGIVILAVMALRLALRKAPKRSICLLWLLAGLRLLVPIQIESPVSLQPDFAPMTYQEWVHEGFVPDYAQSRGEILNENGEVLVTKPLSSDADTQGRGEILNEKGEVLVTKPLSFGDFPQGTGQVNRKSLIPYIWLAGVTAMGLYTTFSYGKLKKKVADAVILEEGVWVSGAIDSPFLLGFMSSKIYLPLGLTAEEQSFVLAHERVHLKRKDHWWKLLGFLALSVHWFNPLVWVGYALLCRDLEMACDEAVVASMDFHQRKAYSAALVSCSARHLRFTACPVAFGEVSVKERVKFVLKFKKPGFWITVLAVVAAICVAVFFLTSPGEQEEEILRAGYTGPGEAYEYYNTGEREIAWEEDVLYLAEALLTEHPYVKDGNSFVYSGFYREAAEFSKALYDPALREDVIDHVDKLIPKLAELPDEAIIYEMQRILALLEDGQAKFQIPYDEQEVLVLRVEPIYTDGKRELYAVCVPAENENVLFGKLRAMNGIAIEEVIEKLMPYIPCENEIGAINALVGWYDELMLTHKETLQLIGVVDAEADSVTLTFETDEGTQSCVMEFTVREERKKIEMIRAELMATDQVQYRYINEKNFWCEMLEESNTLYVHIQNLGDHGYGEMSTFLSEVVTQLRDAQKPVRLVIDLRSCGGMYNYGYEFDSFIRQVNSYETEGVYILIGSNTISAANVVAYHLARGIEDALLMGTPTEQGVNHLIGNVKTLPNAGHVFLVSSAYQVTDPNSSATTLTPDILIYQTLEDYKNGVDTVFEAAVSGEFSRGS